MIENLLTALIAGAVAISGSVITGRFNRRVVQEERKLPPYESLAGRVSGLERQVGEERKRSEGFEDRAKDLEDALERVRTDISQDRDWIKRVIVVAEQRGALENIMPLPSWIDMESDSMRRRREGLQ